LTSREHTYVGVARGAVGALRPQGGEKNLGAIYRKN